MAMGRDRRSEKERERESGGGSSAGPRTELYGALVLDRGGGGHVLAVLAPQQPPRALRAACPPAWCRWQGSGNIGRVWSRAARQIELLRVSRRWMVSPLGMERVLIEQQLVPCLNRTSLT